MKAIRKMNIVKRLLSLTLAAALAVSLLPAEANATEEQTDAPNADNCVIYYYTDATPTLYLWNLSSNAVGAVYRAYDAEGEQIGSATWETNACTMALDLTDDSGHVYVTGQEEGKSESAKTRVSYKYTDAPSVSFNVWSMDSTVVSGYSCILPSSAEYQKRKPSALTEGDYYVVDVVLNNFTKIQSLTLPIKYDPEYLELTKATYGTSTSGQKGYLLGSAVSTPASGTYLPSFPILSTSSTSGGSVYNMGGRPDYGIGNYQDLYDWGVTQAARTGAAETPYVNTTTGLIKLEFSSNSVVDISKLGNKTSSTRKILRLYFKCIKQPTEDSANWSDAEILHIATENDMPSTAKSSTAAYYYYTAYPAGYRASIQTLNILTPPPSIQTGEIYTLTTAALSAERISTMPASLGTSSVSTTGDKYTELLQNHIKIYNYTNSGSKALDDMNDVLILGPTDSSDEAGGTKQGDKLKIYILDSGVYKEIAGGTIPANNGLSVSLGTSYLAAEGGTLYVTLTRNGAESAKAPITYDAEMSRDVYFKVNTTTSTVTDGDAMSTSFRVKTGDQIRLDIYFNNFSDLRAYTFNLTFNTDVVKASDSTFHTLENDGYITRDAVKDKTSCLVAGSDLSEVSFNDELAYSIWEAYQDGSMTSQETLESAEALGIDSLKELEEIHGEVALVYAVGKENAQYGGLLFTGTDGRTDNEVYPYVSNSDGVLRFCSAKLDGTSMELHSSSDGYHFLSVYFVAVQNGEPEFTIKGANSEKRSVGIETVASSYNKYKTEIVLEGPGSSGDTTDTVCSVPFTAHWNAYTMEAIEMDPILRLANGNATEADGDSKAVYLYNGSTYVDYGFVLLSASDAVLMDTAGTSRSSVTVNVAWRKKGATEEEGDMGSFTITSKTKEDWMKNEIDDFVIPEGEYSAEYEMIYQYTYTAAENITRTITATRNIYVIYRKGDLNGDGVVNLFDEQYLLRYGEDSAADDITDDELYASKTFLDQETLHAAIMGTAPIEQDYVMPKENEDSEASGPGSPDTDDFRMWLEFYDTSGTKLDPESLSVGSTVKVKVMYENLASLGDLLNLGFSLSYDPTCYEAEGFDDNGSYIDTSALLSEDVNLDDLAKDDIRVDASDCAADGTLRRIYVQYLNNNVDPDDGTGDGIFAEDTGYLTTISFKVTKEFADKTFCWLDYALTTSDGTSYTMLQLLAYDSVAQEPHFQKPADVKTASITPDGHSISGVVVSYNAKNPVTYELYLMGGDGKYAETPAYTGVAVESADLGAGQHTQNFVISAIPNGTYKLVMKKLAHLSYTVLNLKIDGSNVDLTDAKYSAGINKMSMIPGDVNGDGDVNSNDIDLTASPAYYRKTTDSLAVEFQKLDINGDGDVNSNDLDLIANPSYYRKNESACVFAIP